MKGLLGSIDENLRAIRAVENAWNLPKLPDGVSLDLAAFSGLDALGMQDLLTGLDSDVSDATNPPAPAPTTRTYSLGQQVRRVASGIGNVPLPTDVSPSGVISFKERAIRHGYLDPKTALDSTWNPGLNSVYHKMRQDDFTRAKQGNVPGPGSSIGQVMETFDKWLSPTGLLEAATELGLFWDEDQIATEFENWNPLGDLKAALTSKNPIDGFKNLWSALGPVDDVLMPAVNIALLASGVGQVALFARAAKGGLAGAKALQAAHGAKYFAPISNVSPRLGRLAMETADVGADVARMQQGGIIGSRILPNASVLEASGKTVGATRMAVGKQMEAWRKVPEVMITKKGVQKGMQLGFASRVEDKLGINPDRSLSDLPGVQSVTQFMRGYGEPTKMSLPASIMFEAMFTPTLIIQPGVLRNPFGYLANFRKVGQDAFYTEEFTGGVRNHILRTADEANEVGKTPEEILESRAKAAKEWDDEVRSYGATGALARRFMGWDGAVGEAPPDHVVDQLGGWMTWIGVSSAIEADAAKHIGLMENIGDAFVDGPLKFTQNFHTARNNLIAQVRYVDPDDVPGALRILALAKAKTVAEATELFGKYMEDIAGNPQALEVFGQMIEQHNVTRIKVIQRLLDTHLSPGMLELSVTEKLDNMGDWYGFTEASDLIDEAWDAGKLTGAKSLRGVNPETGRMVGTSDDLIKQEPSAWGPFTEPDHPLHIDIRDVLNSEEFLTYHGEGTFNLFGEAFDPGGKYTVARKSTISKKDKVAELKAIEHLEAVRDATGRLTRNPALAAKWRKVLVDVETQFGITTENFGDIQASRLKKVLKEAGITNVDDVRRINRLRVYSKKHGIDVEGVTDHVTRRLDDIEKSDRWSKVHGIRSDLEGGLSAKKNALSRQIAYTASEVDPETIPVELAQKLDEAGYKLVHGVEFMSPRDLQGALVEVKDIVDKAKYHDSLGLIGRKWGDHLVNAETRAKRLARSVGRTGQRYTRDQVKELYGAQMRNSLQRALYSINSGGRDFGSVDSADMNALIERLQDLTKEISLGKSENIRRVQGLDAPHPRENTWVRGVENLKSSFSPGAPADLVRTRRLTNSLISELRTKYGYTDEEIVAIIDGLKRARVVGPQLRGTMVHMQDKLQSQPNLTNLMRLYGKTVIVNKPRGGKYLAEGAQFLTRSMGTLLPGAALGTASYALAEDDPSPWHWGGMYLTGRGLSGTKIAYRAQAGLLKKMGIKTVRTGNKGAIVGPAYRMDNSLSPRGWKHYSYLTDHLSSLRDFMRFSLSPIFDASRYAEGMVLSQIGHIPESVQKAGGLRFNISPSRWRKDRARQIAGSKKPDASAVKQAQREWEEVQSEFAGIGMRRNDFDFDALEAGTARFRQIGVLGFNTQDWMASLYADLTRIHKMDPMEAYETAKKAYTYGLNPRSAAEMNVNAVFFPFSFTKKTFGHAANFLSQDWSRAAMLHDAIKTYEMLDEHYDLHDLWRDRMPILEKLQRLNVFAYGATPGEFGGANRPYINFLNQSGVDEVTINPVLNAFLPQGAEIRNSAAMSEYDSTLRRLAPIFNDMEHLIEDMSEQGHVVFGGTGLTRAAEAERGYAKIESYNRWIDQQIRLESGKREDGTPVATIADIRKKRWDYYYDKQQRMKEDVRRRYPGYQEAVAASVGNSIIKAQEEKELIAGYKAYGQKPSSSDWDAPREVKLGYLLNWSDNLLKKYGSYDRVPPEKIDNYRGFSSLLAEDERYVRLGWKKHLLRTWGPIETVLD